MSPIPVAQLRLIAYLAYLVLISPYLDIVHSHHSPLAYLRTITISPAFAFPCDSFLRTSPATCDPETYDCDRDPRPLSVTLLRIYISFHPSSLGLDCVR